MKTEDFWFSWWFSGTVDPASGWWYSVEIEPAPTRCHQPETVISTDLENIINVELLKICHSLLMEWIFNKN
jgi:hypothetical protein